MPCIFAPSLPIAGQPCPRCPQQVTYAVLKRLRGYEKGLPLYMKSSSSGMSTEHGHKSGSHAAWTRASSMPHMQVITAGETWWTTHVRLWRLEKVELQDGLRENALKSLSSKLIKKPSATIFEMTIP